MTTVPQTDTRWRKASRSQNEGACVELHPDGKVRDSKNSTGAVLRVELRVLLAVAKAGTLDL